MNRRSDPWGQAPGSAHGLPAPGWRRLGPRGLALAGWLALVVAAGAAFALLPLAARPDLGASSVQLRVIGASNSAADQAVKLQVRDVVLAALGPGLAGLRSAAAADRYIRARESAIRTAAAAAAARAGQGATVRFGVTPLPPRRIGLLGFPAARTPALVVTLGAGLGHNWWTVLFPPLALVTVRGDLVVVGPAGASEPVADLSPQARQALLAWVAGRTGVALDGDIRAGGPDGATGTQVQVRFLLWDLARSLPWDGLRAALVRATAI